MRLLGYLALAAVLAWTPTAIASEGRNIYLAQAKVFYQGLEFEKCLQRLEQAGRLAETTREEMAQIELFFGLCRFNLGKRAEAQSNFKTALELDPDISLPPATSPRIAEVFDPLATQARKNRPAPKQVASASPAANPAATAEPGKPAKAAGPTAARASDAPRSVAATRPSTPPNSDLVAKGPGLENKVLPIALGGTSVAAAGLATFFGVMAKNHEAQANDPATYYAQAQTLGADAQREAVMANVFIGVATAAAAGAVITWITSE